jgi:hypothetical protein
MQYFGMLKHQSGEILKERGRNGHPIPFKPIDAKHALVYIGAMAV